MHDEVRKLEAIDALLTAARELLGSAPLRGDDAAKALARRNGRYVVVVDGASPIDPHVRIDCVVGCGSDIEAITVFRYTTAPGFFHAGDAA
jgi:hypothetical protein